MNLVYITASLPYGPGESFIISEINGLLMRGNFVRIVPMHGRGPIMHEGAQELLAHCLTGDLLNLRIVRGALMQLFESPFASLRAFKLLWTARPLHLAKNLSVYLKGLWLAGEARRMGIDHIHVHWAATTASMGMIASEVSGIPWSFTAHRWDIVENNILVRKTHHAKFVRFISSSGLAMAYERGLSEKASSIVIHMGVKMPSQVMSFSCERSKKRVLCPANLIPVKGHRYLLEAIAQLPAGACELWLAGHGVLEQELRQQIEDLGLQDRVRFLGQLPHRALLNLYHQNEVDLVVLPSLDLGGGLHEGIPVSLIEAMAHGVPVISTQTGGIPELLRDGAGLLVPSADASALAEAIGELLTSSERRQEQGSAGRERVQAKFSESKVLSELEQKFRKGSKTP